MTSSYDTEQSSGFQNVNGATQRQGAQAPFCGPATTYGPPPFWVPMDLTPSLGLLLHPDKPWPSLRLHHHHHRCYAKPDRNGETDSKKGNPHGRVPAVLKCGIERAEGTLVPGGAHIAPRVPWRTGRNRPLAESVRMKIRPPAPTRRAPRRIAKRRSIRPPAETRAAFPC